MNNPDGERIPEVEPDPYEKERIKFWQDMGKEFVKGSYTPVDECSRQILQINGMLISLYGAVFAFSDLKELALKDFQKMILLLPLGFFLLSLIFALIEFFPEKSKINLISHTSIEKFYRKTLKEKLFYMRISAVCLIFGVAAMLVAAGLYLFEV